MFKGYVATNGKVPTTKYKNTALLSSPPKNGDYAGILNDDIIQIDLDDSNEANIIYSIIQDIGISCPVLKTSRGLHFYFKNSLIKNKRIKVKSAIGVTIDIGLGSKNSIVPLMVNGAMREWLEQTEEPDTLPDWLLPIDKHNIDFFNMKTGDGRNQTLFNYILTLQRNGLSKASSIETLRLINNYIFKEPLTEREFEVITRDEAFPEEIFFGVRNKFLHDKFGNHIIAECNCVFINGELHSYKDGIYTPNESELTRIMTAKIPSLKQTQKIEVLRYMKDAVPIVEKNNNSRYIGLKSKVYDIETNRLIDYSPSLYLQHKLNVDYDPKAYDSLTDKTLDKICCGNKRMRMLLEEMVGFCLYRRNELGTAFFLTEDGSNGKSTFVRMIRGMFGDENISKASLEDLSDRFRGAMIVGKLINIGDDIGNGFVGNTSRFKALVTGDAVVMERKGKDPFEYDNYAKFIFTLNTMPRMNDKSRGLYRRMIIIPFKAVFDKKAPDFDAEIIDKLTTTDALNYLFLLALQGLKRVRNGDFTEVEEVKAEMESYERENNPVLYFFEEHEVENQSVKEVYRKYDLWSRERGYQPLSDNMFGKEVRKHLGLVSKTKRIGKEVSRIYQKNVTDA